MDEINALTGINETLEESLELLHTAIEEEANKKKIEELEKNITRLEKSKEKLLSKMKTQGTSIDESIDMNISNLKKGIDNLNLNFEEKEETDSDEEEEEDDLEEEPTLTKKEPKKEEPKPPKPTPTPPTKPKDTKIICKDRTTPVNVPVDLEAYLQDDNKSPLQGKTITFQVAGKDAGSAVTNSNGKARVSFSSSTADSYRIKVDFAGDGEYNASSDKATLTVIDKPIPPVIKTPEPEPSKSNKFNADLKVTPYKIHRGEVTKISIQIEKVYPHILMPNKKNEKYPNATAKHGEKYTLKQDELYYLLFSRNKDIYPIDNAGALLDAKGKIKCNINRQLLETTIKPSEDAVIGARQFMIYAQKKTGENSAILYPTKNCFEVVKAEKEGFLSHEFKVIVDAVGGKKSEPEPKEEKLDKNKIDFAIAPKHIYKSGEEEQEKTILIELYNVPDDWKDKISINKIKFDDYKDVSHIMLKNLSIEQQGGSMLYKAKILIKFDTKIGHPLITLTLAIGNQGEDNYKEFDIVKKDAVELFDPQASASDKKLERGMDERQYITVNLKGMKIDKSKSYIIRFVPSAKMDINKLDDEIDFGDTAGIEVLEAHFIDEKNIKLCLKIPDDELLGSYDLEIEEDNKDDDNPQNNPTT